MSKLFLIVLYRKKEAENDLWIKVKDRVVEHNLQFEMYVNYDKLTSASCCFVFF